MDKLHNIKNFYNNKIQTHVYILIFDLFQCLLDISLQCPLVIDFNIKDVISNIHYQFIF